MSHGDIAIKTIEAAEKLIKLQPGRASADARQSRRPDRSRARLADGQLRIGEAAEDAARFEVPQGISLWAGLFDEGRSCNHGMALEMELGFAERRPIFAT